MSNHSLLPLYEKHSWQRQLQDAIRTPETLAEAVGLAPDDLPFSRTAAGDFPLLVPRAFAARMERGNPRDPLLRQVLAVPEETESVAGYGPDPVGEQSRYADEPGLIRKYRGRALLVATGQCAVNCRYCFRRHYPYGDNAVSSQLRGEQIDALLDDDGLQEIILSGGDPLLLGDRQLGAIAGRIAARRRDVTLRLHTRLPIVIPDRVDEAFLAALTHADLKRVVVVHSNHPREIDGETSAAIARMVAAGITVLNQSVLLAGINDDADTLGALSDALFRAGALPYYLHLLDPVAGAAHFHVAEDRAQRLVGDLAARRPGYLVPRLMRELPGAASKRELAPHYDA